MPRISNRLLSVRPLSLSLPGSKSTRADSCPMQILWALNPSEPKSDGKRERTWCKFPSGNFGLKPQTFKATLSPSTTHYLTSTCLEKTWSRLMKDERHVLAADCFPSLPFWHLEINGLHLLISQRWVSSRCDCYGSCKFYSKGDRGCLRVIEGGYMNKC